MSFTFEELEGSKPLARYTENGRDVIVYSRPKYSIEDILTTEEEEALNIVMGKLTKKHKTILNKKLQSTFFDTLQCPRGLKFEPFPLILDGNEVVFVFGPKGSGKSVFVSLYGKNYNRYIGRPIYLISYKTKDAPLDALGVIRLEPELFRPKTILVPIEVQNSEYSPAEEKRRDVLQDDDLYSIGGSIFSGENTGRVPIRKKVTMSAAENSVKKPAVEINVTENTLVSEVQAQAKAQASAQATATATPVVQIAPIAPMAEKERLKREKAEERERVKREKEEEKERVRKEKAEERERVRKEKEEEREKLKREKEEERERLKREKEEERERIRQEKEEERERREYLKQLEKQEKLKNKPVKMKRQVDYVSCDEFSDCLIIFDDIDVIGDKELRHGVQNFMNQVISYGRARGISCVVTGHLSMEGHSTKHAIKQSDKYVFFPNSSDKSSIYSLLQEYMKMKPSKIDSIVNRERETRWMCINKASPQFVLTERELFTY
jgi:hypothetical protein